MTRYSRQDIIDHQPIIIPDQAPEQLQILEIAWPLPMGVVRALFTATALRLSLSVGDGQKSGGVKNKKAAENILRQHYNKCKS